MIETVAFFVPRRMRGCAADFFGAGDEFAEGAPQAQKHGNGGGRRS